MSALYLGKGQLEKFLVFSLDKRLKASPSLRVSMVFDFFRGSRIDKSFTSSETMLRELKAVRRNFKKGSNYFFET